ncbi:hypothetical protein WJX74_000302 [Apatococcus lobatus]|uniref:Nucleotide-diphospho-sugar transferase domain-containing protein n=1 Tax=Apatococcus lobatus TaxID=904363 RepID=A0AAW1QYI4_9CHLO
MPERARLQPLRKRRFAAEGLTLQKIFAAVLLGATLGLLASVVRVASQSRVKGAPEPSRSEAITAWQTSQQANLLSDEKHRRELAEQARRQILLESTRLKNDLQHAEAVADAAQHDREAAMAQASQAQNHLDQLSSTVQQLVQRNEQAAKEAQAAKLEAQEATKQAHTVTTRVKFGLSSRHDRHSIIHPSSERDASNPKLAGLLRKVAIDQEVLVAICTKEMGPPGGMLSLWGQAVQQAGIDNAIVAALDPDCLRVAEHLRMPAFQPSLQGGAFGATAKFQALSQRDSDVEAASDGFTNATAYGQVKQDEDNKSAPGNPTLKAEMMGLSPGLFFVRPTRASLDLVDLITSRLLARPSANPNKMFNEAILMPTSTQHISPGVHARVLDYMDFINSGTLFSRVKGNPLLETHPPIMIHLSCHADKLPRMHAIINHYINHDSNALSEFS